MKRAKYKILGKRFRELREELNTFEKICTQANLAKKLNLTAPQISDLEKGKKAPSLNVLKEYCNYFKVPMEYLVDEKKEYRHYQNQTLSEDLGLSDDAILGIRKLNSFSNKLEKDNKNLNVSKLNLSNLLNIFLSDYMLLSSFLLNFNNYLEELQKEEEFIVKIKNTNKNLNENEIAEILHEQNLIEEKLHLALYRTQDVLKKIAKNINKR